MPNTVATKLCRNAHAMTYKQAMAPYPITPRDQSTR
jgi:hypothetical protein